MKSFKFTYQNYKSYRWLILLFLLFTPLAFAGGGGEETINFLWIAIILLLAKLSSLVEKFKQPAVLGELIIGVIIGNLFLFGIGIFEPIKANHIILFLAQLGVVILLFQIGLESNIEDMLEVGITAFLVAIVGVVVPFFLGFYAGKLLMPGLDFNSYLFLGATLTATSVGITGRVFRDFNKLDTKEAKIVLGAAVIDDVMGLIILAVVSAIVVTGTITVSSVSLITAKAVAFLVLALFLGQLLAPYIGRFFSKIQTGMGMKFTIAISFGLIFAYLAYLAGLAPIIGAFAAGLLLEPVHFHGFDHPEINKQINNMIVNADSKTKENVEKVLTKYNDHHIDYLVEPLSYFLVPIFFVVTGMQVKLETLFDPKILGIALIITALAFISKLVSGLVAGKNVNKWIVGWGMAPRGEVGLIFATIGAGLGVISDELFSVIIIMVILTTLFTPPILNHLLRKSS
jgi:Kef-type K+ transport system membrane component KefB